MKLLIQPSFKTLLTAFVVLISVVVFSSCEENSATNPRWYEPKEGPETGKMTITPEALWGHWVCKDFTDLVSARRSVRFVHTRPLFIEIVFDPSYGDSALLITAYEDFFAPWEKGDSNQILIKNVTPGKDIILSTEAGAPGLMLTDTLDKRGEKQIHNWTFIKASEEDVINNGSSPSAISSAINHAILEGDYLQANGTGIPVTFAKNGTISGWPMYNKYRICMGGDCFRLTHATVDIVQFIGSQNIDYFAFATNSAADSLFFYKLDGGTPDKSYSYKTGELTYALGKLK